MDRIAYLKGLLDGQEIGWLGMLAHDLTDETVPEHSVFRPARRARFVRGRRRLSVSRYRSFFSSSMRPRIIFSLYRKKSPAPIRQVTVATTAVLR